jgi:hypothetical protein
MADHYQQYATVPQPVETYETAAEWLISQLSGNILAKRDVFKVAVHQANRELGQEAGQKFTLTLFIQAEDYPRHNPTLKIPVTGIIKSRLMGLAREKGSRVDFNGLGKNITAWIVELEGWIEDGAPTPPSTASSSSSSSPSGPASGNQPSSRRGSHSGFHSSSHPGSHHQSRGISQFHSNPVSPQHGSHHGSLPHSQHSSHPGSEHGSRRSSISHPPPPSRAGSEYGSPSPSQAGPDDPSSTTKRRRSSSTSNKMAGFFGGKKPKGK